MDPVRASARSVASAAQLKRFSKIYNEPFYVISSEATDEGAEFDISGSTGSSYHVKIDKSDGRVSCSCPDTYMNCRRLNCHCKHVCFLVYRVFRITDLTFLNTLKLRQADTDTIITRLITDDFDRMQIRHDHSSGNSSIDFYEIKREPALDDDCPVCYCALVTTTASTTTSATRLMGCPDCGNAVHEGCARRWIAHAKKPTCVYCRSEVWVNM